jgi:hypothetical protein
MAFNTEKTNKRMSSPNMRGELERLNTKIQQNNKIDEKRKREFKKYAMSLLSPKVLNNLSNQKRRALQKVLEKSKKTKEERFKGFKSLLIQCIIEDLIDAFVTLTVVGAFFMFFSTSFLQYRIHKFAKKAGVNMNGARRIVSIIFYLFDLVEFPGNTATLLLIRFFPGKMINNDDSIKNLSSTLKGVAKK